MEDSSFMQDPLRILVVHDDLSDPVVSLLASQQNALKHEIAFVSLKEFIEKIQVSDKLDINGVAIQWRLKDNDDLTKPWTNHNTYLVNRCHNLKETWDSLFHPDDREYAWNELTAYLNFAFTAFKYRIQPVSYYGLSGSVMPLFVQWDQLRGKLAGLHVPKYYVGPYYLIKWSKAVVNRDPYDVTYWVAKDVNNDTRSDYVFAYERPIGQPVFVYITPIGADIVKSDSLNKEAIDAELLKRFGMNIGKRLGIRLGEILFFVSAQQIIFGAATPRIINVKNTPNFQALTLKALTTASAYDNPDDLLFVNHANQRAAGDLIAIGSTQDRTISNLVASQAFSKSGVLLPLEEFTINWNFSYANGKLKFLTKDITLEAIGAIYYRPFHQQEDKNDFLDLLHACLDSFDGLVYGRGASQYLNSSKPLQLANILPTINGHNSIVFPNTTIIKVIHSEDVISPPKGTKYITKSISGIRSIVVNNETFATWSKDGLNALPALFQEQIAGDDVRVHVCHNKVFAVKISNKDVVDYRYSATFSLKEIAIPQEIVAFCLTISRVEQNPLIGIDLIQTTYGYAFLEANPMPGWEWFYRNNAAVREDICNQIMEGS